MVGGCDEEKNRESHGKAVLTASRNRIFYTVRLEDVTKVDGKRFDCVLLSGEWDE